MLDITHNRTSAVASLATARSVRTALVIFLVARLLLTLWAGSVISVMPPPETPNEFLRPLLGEPVLSEGVAGFLLGPWQRFDTMHYLAIARQGYDAENSVFPPLFPLAMRGLGAVMSGITGMPTGMANLSAALLISNLALLGMLVLLYRVTAREIDEEAAVRTLAYLVFFPVGFFLYAGYTESLFLLFAIGSMWAAREERLWWAGLLGLLASLTRLTGWVLVLPLAYEYARRRQFNWRRVDWTVLATGLPLLGFVVFVAWRAMVGLPPLSAVYQQYWYQQTSFPGVDVMVALRTLLTGNGPRAGEYSLLLDVASLILLTVTTIIAFRRLGPFYAFYSLALLFFMLLPTSDVKPLYSFSRYTLAFFPTFMLLGAAGRKPLLNRLILYPSLVLYLFFSGQFFLWGWVA